MSIFIGTKSEFQYFLSGYCRNKVLEITKPYKKIFNSYCEYCGNKAELQAAHVSGFERTKLIDEILEEYFKDGVNYKVDLNEFEKIFVEKHQPLDKHFHFLCSSCHTKYDHGQISETEMQIKKKAREVVTITKPIQTSNSRKTRIINYNDAELATFKDKEDLYKKDDETIQNYVKRVLILLYNNNLIPDSMMEQLQNKNYCKLVFDLEYPLLEQDKSKISPAGRNRYYTTWQLGQKYYVCSQWWKDNFPTYERKLCEWINKLIEINNL